MPDPYVSIARVVVDLTPATIEWFTAWSSSHPGLPPVDVEPLRVKLWAARAVLAARAQGRSARLLWLAVLCDFREPITREIMLALEEQNLV